MDFPLRKVLPLDRGWQFVRRRASRAWLRGDPCGDAIAVDLPHCWNDRDTFQESVAYYRGLGAYRRSFALPAGEGASPDLRWFLESDGFYGRAEIRVGGRRVARQEGEFLGLDVDLSEHLRPGQPSVLALQLDNRHRRNMLPGIEDPDFLLYGGLAGGLRLVGRPVPCFAPEGIRVASRPLGDSAWTVSVEASFAPPGAARLDVRWRLLSPAGRLVAEAAAHASGDGATACELRVDGADVWDVDSPALYTLEGELAVDGAVRDGVRLRIGLRTAEFRADEGFFLNGRRVELRGCNRHESMPGFGNALPAWLHEEDARLMRDAGLNFVRLSHYPQHPAFLDACDRLGLLVYAELATWKSVTARPGWLRAAERQWRRLLARDRHHPCVIVWGMGNESRSRRAYTRLAAAARAGDPEQRVVTYAENHLYRAVRRRTVGLPDVWGLNYEFDALEAGRDASRRRVVIVTECSNEPGSRRESLDAQIRQVRTIDADLARLDGKPWAAGYALWSFNDYATIRKGRQYRHCGLVDAWRTPKAAWAYLRARTSRDPVVILLADWQERAPDPGAGADDPRTVCVLTNCERLEAAINGCPAGSWPACNPLVLRLPFQAGELTMTGYRGAAAIASDRCLSWAAPAAIRVEPESPVLPAGSGGVTGLRIRVVDAAGRTAAHWSGSLAVRASGPVDICGYDRDDDVRVAGGTGRAFARAGREEGVATVTVSGEGLVPGSVELRVISGGRRHVS